MNFTKKKSKQQPIVTTNELVITRLSRHHLLAILMCQAINSNITTTATVTKSTIETTPTTKTKSLSAAATAANQASNSITLDLNLKPSEVRITQLTPILVAGLDALFECNTFGSRPMPIIYWLFDGNRYDTRIHGEQQTSSTITLRLERRHRGMIIECITENVRIPNSAIRDQWTLDVQYPPQMELKLGAPSLSLDAIQEGIDIYFDCHIDSNPSPTTPITWLFNGEPIVPEPGIIESNQSLVLQRVQRYRNGTYQCKCSNQQGTMISNEIKLQIKFAPVCKIPYTLIYGLQLNEIIQIECEIESQPSSDVSFQWHFEKHINLANFIVINKTKSILEYVPRTRDQYGLIECIAKNSIGIQRESCKYLIVPVANPYFPYQCLVSNQSDSTISIRCDGTFVAANQTSIELINNYDKHYIKHKQNNEMMIDDNYIGNDDIDDDKNYYKNRKFEQISSDTVNILNNLSTTDIYSMYFAPDLGQQINESNQDISQSSIKMVKYRNGIGSLQQTNNNKQHSTASLLFLNELVNKFNSHILNQQPHLLVYPPTYYICEIYSLINPPRSTLIKNLTIDAIDKRIMNPMINGSFSFLIDDLPANTPLLVNIYAKNNANKRSVMQIKLNTKTLRAAERRIDYEGHHYQQGQLPTRRKSYLTFFDELYSGYGRWFRQKHLVVGLIILTVTITIIIAIILITIAILRSRHYQQNSDSNSNCNNDNDNDNDNMNIENSNNKNNEFIMLDDKIQQKQKQQQQRQSPLNHELSKKSFKRKMSRINHNSDNNNDQVMETIFSDNNNNDENNDDDDNLNNQLENNKNIDTIDTMVNNGYGMNLINVDDDNSIRSDNQLIHQQQPSDSNKYLKILMTKSSQQQRVNLPSTTNLNYYDHLTNNLTSESQQQPPDIIQNVLFNQQNHHYENQQYENQKFFDTISFGQTNSNIDNDKNEMDLVRYWKPY